MEISAGIYEQLINEEVAGALRQIDQDLVQTEALDPTDSDAHLAQYLVGLVARALRAHRGDSPDNLASQVDVVNAVIATLREHSPRAFVGTDEVVSTADLLLAVMRRPSVPGPATPPIRPEVPLSSGALLVNGRGQPRVGTEIARELATADTVDLLCAFVKWHGFRVLESELAEVIERGGQIRVITTTYMGATDRRALDALVQMGASVKVSYETRTTRLHAKAWIFQRGSGFSTAYVGSSNLSRAALLDGLEWNVRMSGIEQPHLLDTFTATFEGYWEDSSFEDYDPQTDSERFDLAIAAERGAPTELPSEITTLHVQPWPFQSEVLEELDAERQIHDRWRNLVVMATGTGKTVVSALDYQRLRRAGVVDRVLFVAHREEILQQSLHTFRAVTRDGSFGELLVGGSRPVDWQHVFASIQSMANVALGDLDPAHFDMVIVDEFHHAEAPTYERLLSYVRPKVLLGLTATPERTDGRDVRRWFDGHISAELRLWEALERGLLCPFQYFGVHDDVDLRRVSWRQGRYDTTDLTNLYTADHARAQKIVQSVRDKVSDFRQMRALGFCVSVDHAKFMAERFNLNGIPSIAVSAETPRDERQGALRDLRDGRINTIFAVDLFNEGVDVPEIDTVLFLRPTESATVFLQQLGRGLRLSEEKSCLTVLDFIGNQHAKFRFDQRYRALSGASRRDIEYEVQNGFPYLPAGCHIELDRVSKEIVLGNVRHALRAPWSELVAELRQLGDVPLSTFLVETGFELEDVYRRAGRGWLELRREAGFVRDKPIQQDRQLGSAFRRMLHIDDRVRMDFIREIIGAPEPPTAADLSPERQRLLAMLHFSLWGSKALLGPGDISPLWKSSRRQELLELVALLADRAHRVTYTSGVEAVPLMVHGTYSRDEALAAFGFNNPRSVMEGVKFIKDEGADLLFVTLNKTEKHFSPTTMYADMAITPRLFQWESQSKTSVRSPTGQRYLGHRQLGSSVHLLIRESKWSPLKDAAPYLYAGEAEYVSHERDRPIRIIWRLERDLPTDLYQAARAIAG